MTRKPLFIAMVGMPGSGKSTVARILADMLREERGHCWISDTDSYIEQVAAQQGTCYQAIHRDPVHAKRATQAMWHTMLEAARQDVSVVLDRLNHRRKARKRALRTIGLTHFRCAVVMPTSDEEAWKRNERRCDRPVPWHNFLEMKETYEHPQLGEGFDAIIQRADPLAGAEDIAADFWQQIMQAESSIHSA